MNIPSIFANLPGLKDTRNENDVVESKHDRIKFHREKVRNGPVRFKTPTAGQERRSRARLTASMQRKAYRRQVRDHLAARREGAILRGQLQAAGVLAYVLPETRHTPEAALSAITWIVARFSDDVEHDDEGRIEVTETVVRNALQSALNRWQAIFGLEATELREDYVLPVEVAA